MIKVTLPKISLRKFIIFLLLAVLIITLVFLANYYFYYFHNDKFLTFEHNGIKIVMDRKLDKKEIIKYLNKVKGAISEDEVKGLDFILFKTGEEFLSAISAIPQVPILAKFTNSEQLVNEENTTVLGLYSTLPGKRVTICMDRVEDKRLPYLDEESYKTYLLLHELSHHIDLHLQDNELDEKAEYRASKIAVDKMRKLGLEIDHSSEEILTHKNDEYSGKL